MQTKSNDELKSCRNFYTPKQVKASGGDVWYYRTNRYYHVYVDSGNGKPIEFKLFNRRSQ